MSVLPWMLAVPAQRHDAAAGTADIAEQALDDRGRTDDLHADRMMRPAHRVAERAGAFAPGVVRDGVGRSRRNVSRGQPVTRSTISGV